MAILPQGTVTFLFTDIEGSTRLVEELGPRYREVLERHHALLREAFRAGAEVGTEGDSFFVAFASATEAVAAAADGQRALAGEAWPEGQRVLVRMGLHTGQASLGPGGYVGFDVHRAARIAAAGYGGQVLLSESTHALVSRDLPDGATSRDLGPHRLKDLTLPERIFQLVVPGLEADFPALRTLDTRRTNLPAQLTSFVGRERELLELQALAGKHRLVTVIGTGGTGKTRLMVQAAAELVGEQAGGVWLVELAPISDPDLIVQAVARGLDIREDPGRPLIDTVFDFLRMKPALVLLDNCEHLIATVADLVERLLASAPHISVMATSREALGVAGEHVYQVPSLGLPDVGHEWDEHGARRDASFEVVQAAEAVRLFVERATAVLPSFALTPADAPAVVEICRRLDGIPLAIELAAARVPLLSVDEIAMRLGDRFRLLTGGRRTALPRQQTLQALIDWSWDLLTDDERRLLRRLSVFAGGCTLEAADEVARLREEPGAGPAIDTLDAIGRLVGRSLVVVDRGGSTRYHLLETIRQYARDRLVAAEETAELRNRHLAFYLRLAVEAEPQLLGPDLAAWLSRLDADADNLRAAIDWSFDEDPAAALRMCTALQLYWRTRSLAEGLDHLRRAAEVARTMRPADTAADPERALIVSRSLTAAANASWMAGSASIGVPWAREGLEIAREVGDAAALGEALSAMAITTIFTGEVNGVAEWSQEAVQLAESIGAWSYIAFLESGLSQWDVELGDEDAATARLAAATVAAERSGNPEAIAFTSLSRGRVDGFGGRLADARRWFATAIDGYSRVGDKGLVLVARSDLAHALRLNGAIDEAVAVYRQTLHGWQHAGNRGAIANQLESVAFVALTRDDYLRAARLLAAAEATREAADAPMLPFERREYEAAVATVRERLDGPTFESAWAEGRRVSTDEAVALALDAL